MRRTLAMLGAAALAVAGLASPANASDIDAQTDIAFSSSTGLNNTGVQPDTNAPDHAEAWFDLVSTSGVAESLDGMNVIACVGANADPFLFMDPSYDSTHIVPSSGVFKTADLGYTGSANERWADSGVLFSEDFDVRLIDSASTVIDTASQNPGGTLEPECTNQMPT